LKSLDFRSVVLLHNALQYLMGAVLGGFLLKKEEATGVHDHALTERSVLMIVFEPIEKIELRIRVKRLDMVPTCF
jgi:hypothetical protein